MQGYNSTIYQLITKLFAISPPDFVNFWFDKFPPNGLRACKLRQRNLTFKARSGPGWRRSDTVRVLGLVLAPVHLWQRSLVAPMAMHFLQGFISIVLPPLAWIK